MMELKRLNVLQTGKVLAALYGLFAVVILAFLVIGLALSPQGKENIAPMIVMVVLYPIIGFVGGVLLAVFYNLIARWVGGLRFDLEHTQDLPK